MADLKNRKIHMFRCHLDPQINGKSQNAFSKTDPRFAGWEFELTPVGVYVAGKTTLPGGKEVQYFEHLVPFANVQSIQLIVEDKDKAPERKGA